MERKLTFVVGDKTTKLKSKINTCHLSYIDWNDYGYNTSFSMVLWMDENTFVNLGRLRIMHQRMNQDNRNILSFLSRSFDKLDQEFCSLGISQRYYEVMATLPFDIKNEILSSLRDCSYDDINFQKYKNHPTMEHSLLRELDEQRVTVLFPSIIGGTVKLTPFQFRYLINGNPSLSIDVEVKPYSTPPSNIHVLIGRNGVGKTRIISGIIDKLTKRQNQISLPGILEFVEADNSEISNQKFVNLVAVVFSAFDHFKPAPKNNKAEDSVRSHYIGLKKSDGTAFKTPNQIQNEFKMSINKIADSVVAKKLWSETIEKLNSDPIFNSYELNKKDLDIPGEVNKVKQTFNNLSSGHRIVLLTITLLVELVDEKSLVLIDEPENHLHPPLLSSFTRAISDLLIRRNGVALIATHSPVVLQEVPSYCVTKIDRVNDEFILYRPSIETYAENIDTLTREVFGLELENSGFYKMIKERIESQKDYSFDKFMEEFGGNVGAEGRALAKSIIVNLKKN